MTQDWNTPLDLPSDLVAALSEGIMQIHGLIVSDPDSMALRVQDSPEAQGAVESAVSAALCSHFGAFPCETRVGQIVKLTILIAKDHCFSDGNKRTATITLAVLLKFFVDETARIDCSQELMADIIQQVASCKADMMGPYEVALTKFVEDCLRIREGIDMPRGGAYSRTPWAEGDK